MSARLGRGAWPLYLFTGLMMVFVLAPLFVVVSLSVSNNILVSFPPHGFTLRWYAKILQDSYFLAALRLSILVALGATIASLALGVPAAVALTRSDFWGKGALQGLLLSPLIFPGLVAGLALMQVLSTMNSVDARVNLLIGYTLVSVPYVVRAVSTSLLLTDTNLESAARTLGAGPLKAFWRITLPQIIPGVAAGAVLSFMVAFDNYPMAMWLGDSHYSPIPQMLMQQLNTAFDPSVPAISTVMILLALVCIVVIERLVGLRQVTKA